MQYIDYHNIDGFIQILNYYMEPCISYRNELYWVSWSNDKTKLFFANTYGKIQTFNSVEDFLGNATMNDGKPLSKIWNEIDELVA